MNPHHDETKWKMSFDDLASLMSVGYLLFSWICGLSSPRGRSCGGRYVPRVAGGALDKISESDQKIQPFSPLSPFPIAALSYTRLDHSVGGKNKYTTRE